jgi:hypothetical protein
MIWIDDEDGLDHHRVWHDWRSRIRLRMAAFPGDGPTLWGAPLGARCTDAAHDDAGAYCHQCRNTGRLPAPTPRPCRSVP